MACMGKADYLISGNKETDYRVLVSFLQSTSKGGYH